MSSLRQAGARLRKRPPPVDLLPPFVRSPNRGGGDPTESRNASDPGHEHKPYAHDHPPVKNANKLHEERQTFGDRLADNFARLVGSWTFITVQTVALIAWVLLNVLAWLRHWDPYPFILLNLALSFQAAYSAPIIMMSQNREAEKDRIAAHLDYETNLRAEQEDRVIIELLERQNVVLAELRQELRELREAMERG